MLGNPPGSRHPHPTPSPSSRHPPWEQSPPRAEPPPGADTPHPGSRPPSPPGSRLQHTVYERPVRILLECILVGPCGQRNVVKNEQITGCVILIEILPPAMFSVAFASISTIITCLLVRDQEKTTLLCNCITSHPAIELNPWWTRI